MTRISRGVMVILLLTILGGFAFQAYQVHQLKKHNEKLMGDLNHVLGIIFYRVTYLENVYLGDI